MKVSTVSVPRFAAIMAGTRPQTEEERRWSELSAILAAAERATRTPPEAMDPIAANVLRGFREGSR